jgi:hypothetical protein
MTAVPFDTLKLARALRDKAHFTPEQAEGAADAIAEAVQTDLATKADLVMLGADLRAEIAEAKSEIIKWMFGTIGFQTIVILGGVIALLRLVKP